jgi:hypothetical protein
VKNSSKYLRSQGIDATLAANVLLDRTVSAAAAVYRPWSRGADFDCREQAIFSARRRIPAGAGL